MDIAINEFLDGRKAARLKSKLKVGISEAESAIIQDEIDKEFLLENWLPNAAKRAGQLSIVSHPGKFSHPSAKTTPFIASAERVADGFIRTGNVDSQHDVLGNAAALDVYKFLSLKMPDGLTILQHLDQPTEVIKKALSIKSQSFDDIRAQFLEIKSTGDEQFSSDLVKQVYFPFSDDYHLLSILTPSGLMFDFRDRIQAMKFSDSVKVAREAKRKNEENSEGFDDIYNLAMIGYGGTKPQNISVLNSENGGKAYLLPCFPPELNRQYTTLPTFNFFAQTLWPKKYSDSFQSLHKLLMVDINNINIREGRDNIIRFVTNEIIDEVWLIRSMQGGWSVDERFGNLPKFQKVMLDAARDEEITNDDKSVEDFIHEMARWFISAYKKVLGNQALAFHDDELLHIKKIMNNSKDDLL